MSRRIRTSNDEVGKDSDEGDTTHKRRANQIVCMVSETVSYVPKLPGQRILIRVTRRW